MSTHCGKKVRMEQYPILKYEALRNSDNIGPLKIPLIPPGVDPDDIWTLIEEERRKRKEKEDRPYSPLIFPEKPNFPPEEPKNEVKNEAFSKKTMV